MNEKIKERLTQAVYDYWNDEEAMTMERAEEMAEYLIEVIGDALKE